MGSTLITELVFVVVIVSVLVAVTSMVSQRNKRLAENARLLEEALKNPAVDRATLETLTYQVTGRRPLRMERKGTLMAWVLALGWLCLFIGIGLLIGSESSGDRDMGVAGWIVGLIGFGFVTYPFALRELEARRAG